MKLSGIREFRANIASLLSSGEPVLLTRHGKISGVYIPLEEPDQIPEDLRRELLTVLGRHLSQQIEATGITEEEIQADFDAHRHRRR